MYAAIAFARSTRLSAHSPNLTRLLGTTVGLGGCSTMVTGAVPSVTGLLGMFNDGVAVWDPLGSGFTAGEHATTKMHATTNATRAAGLKNIFNNARRSWGKNYPAGLGVAVATSFRQAVSLGMHARFLKEVFPSAIAVFMREDIAAGTHAGHRSELFLKNVMAATTALMPIRPEEITAAWVSKASSPGLTAP